MGTAQLNKSFNSKQSDLELLYFSMIADLELDYKIFSKDQKFYVL